MISRHSVPKLEKDYPKKKNLFEKYNELVLSVLTCICGEYRNRTDDLLNAIQTRSQLRYAPISNFTYLL
mgnify:CR=1 FL=1